MIKTDYKRIAPTYNARYTVNSLINIENELKKIISFNNYKNILEAGCGTGRWVGSLENATANIFGLDYSFEMLTNPKNYSQVVNIVNADAVKIPFKDNVFDLVFCVNAIHHFPEKAKFVFECNRTLRNNGMLAVFGVDPHIDKDWYVYDYFDTVYENDLKRFPSLELLKSLLAAEKFDNIEVKIVEEIHLNRFGSDVLNDPFLEKQNCSQLANLSDQDYQMGINKIKKQFEKDSNTMFKTSIIFYLISANKE